ncbi:hypothetical protein [Oleiagrimonas soli]|uniref:Uncharacterized protein n=1 Tax=Oleiagrimonas soli TaxID=1543381 RepID=A0A099CY72_9GAMM|nr:hypothetical protein [Oleiagrimonas soli]KGI78512.1 hypothetical protein LF63_0103300 [Oleiagrimonas soli]MBB6184226.1 hypothetical protein [Oleiagrimonas soli]
MNTEREFQFRGDRKYLQSASLFDDLIRLRGTDVKNIDFKFHQKTGKQVLYADVRPDSQDQLVAEWKDALGRIFVIERDVPITEALPYDEPALVGKFELDIASRSISIPAVVVPFTKIEALVAGFKHLLKAVYPGYERKYVFVRTRLKHLPEEDVVLRYSRDIGDFYQGDILSNSENVGQIFFGEWK